MKMKFYFGAIAYKVKNGFPRKLTDSTIVFGNEIAKK